MSVIKELKEYFNNLEYFSEIEYDAAPNAEPYMVPGVGRLIYVDGYTGREGGGENAYMVFKVVRENESDMFVRKNGYYSSWDGTNWDDGSLYEVKPVQVTRTEYHQK